MLKPLNLSNGAVHLLTIDANTYQWSLHILQSSTISFFALLLLFIWHKRLGHSNFFLLKTHLSLLNIKFNNNIDRYIYNSYLQAKVTKIYHQNPQKQWSKPYQFMHTNLVGAINFVGFLGKKYFFTFINSFTKITESYTKTKNSNWLNYLRIYHSLCKTKSKEDYPIERFKSDYKLEL